MNTSTDLAETLSNLNTYSTPPAELVTEALAAYAERVAELEREVGKLNERIGTEVRWQYSIRDQERKIQAEQAERHKAQQRALIQELGFAAEVYARVTNARWHGRKTVKVDMLLEGQPAVEDAA